MRYNFFCVCANCATLYISMIEGKRKTTILKEKLDVIKHFDCNERTLDIVCTRGTKEPMNLFMLS